MPRGKEIRWVLFFLLVFFLMNLLFLTRYPLVHSDESWLAGLTRNIMESGSLSVTEPFFDLKPRYPHAIKILFHLLQMPFLVIFGYSAFSVRLLSLIASCFALYLVFRCCRVIATFRLSFAIMALVSLNGQFLAAAHTARQEILLLCSLFLLILLLLKSRGSLNTRRTALMGAVTGISVGLHPNSFLLSVGCGLAILFLMLSQRKFQIKPLLAYISVTGMIALLFIGLSFLFDSQFPAHYLAYGESEFDLIVPVSNKFREFFYYLEKLWYGVSGTYILPELKANLVLFSLLLLFAAVKAFRTKEASIVSLIGMILGVLLGTILIGRYNQLSAVLWMLPCYLLLAPLLFNKPWRKAAVCTLAIIFAVSSVISVKPSLAFSYEDYLNQIGTYVSPGEKTLGNLSGGFYFDNGALLDLRNLSYLKESSLSFAEYVKIRNIQVILWPEEMDFIYSRRPAWNMVYGNPRYVGEAEEFLRTRCTYLGEFENRAYAVRIVQEIGKPYAIKAYRVNP